MSQSIKFIHQVYDVKYESTKKLKIPVQLYQYHVDKIIIEYYNKCVIVSATYPEINDKFAIKCIPIQFAQSDRKEAQIMKKLSHPNIIKYQNDFNYPEKNPRFYAIVMNRAVSDLFDYMDNNKAPFKENLICRIMRQSLNAVNYLHEMRICHRDLKPDNILLMQEVKQGVDIAISDFGLSDTFPSDPFCSKCIGSLQYAAPELLEIVDDKLNFKKEESMYDFKIDTWSMGVVLYVLITRVVPFEPALSEDIDRLFEGNPDIDPPKEEDEDDPLNNFRTISEECKDLICLMLKANPEERISVKDALKHPWFNLYNDEDDESEQGYKETAEIFDAINAADSKYIEDI